MEINQLRYFLAVAELGSFSKAAARCYVSQPALSIQIQKLENEVGESLFNRTRRKVRLTGAGKVLVGRARRILTQVEIAKREIRKFKGMETGKVALGILPTIAPYFLSYIMTAFQERWPQVRFTIHEDTTFQLVQMIEENKLDAAIVSLPIHEHGFEKERLFAEELLLALPCRHPLVGKSKIRMENLHCENFILLHEGHCLGSQILDFCNRHDFHPRIALRSGQLATIQSLVRAGVGISLVPQMAATENRAGIVYRSLEQPRPKRVIVVIRREKRPLKRAALEFLKHLRHVGKKFEAQLHEQPLESSSTTWSI